MIPSRQLRLAGAVLLGLVVVALATAPWPPPAHGQSPSADTGASVDTPIPVLVELFTSEGCSSCPPADRLLIELDATQGVAGALIIPLGLHVDYWNRLGWADPFSSPSYTARQHDYAAAFGNSTVYTPQMVVDGGEEFVGSDGERAAAAIARAARAPKADLRLFVRPGKSEDAAVRLAVEVGPLDGITERGDAEVWLAVTESGLASDVSRGENAGRRLEHTAVVRQLWRLGTADPRRSPAFSWEREVKLQLAWHRERLRAVVFLQEYASRRVLGAAAAPLTAD